MVGHDVSDSLNTKSTIRALEMATKNRQCKNQDLIHRSDKGLEYCSDDYQEIKSKYNSM
jgi:transposase InsO family protein